MRTLLVAILLFLGIANAAEMPAGTVIVAEPPVYQAGESATGIMWIASGKEITIHQSVEAGEEGQLYLIKDFLGGDVKLRSVVNLTTAAGEASMGEIRSHSMESNCAREDLYPVVLGKTYDCEFVSVSTDGVTIRSKLHSKIISVQIDAEGRTTGYCALENENHGVGASTTRVCYSADGKWILTAEVLDLVQLIET